MDRGHVKARKVDSVDGEDGKEQKLDRGHEGSKGSKGGRVDPEHVDCGRVAFGDRKGKKGVQGNTVCCSEKEEKR